MSLKEDSPNIVLYNINNYTILRLGIKISFYKYTYYYYNNYNNLKFKKLKLLLYYIILLSCKTYEYIIIVNNIN